MSKFLINRWILTCVPFSQPECFAILTENRSHNITLFIISKQISSLTCGDKTTGVFGSWKVCWMFQFESGFPFHWLLKTRQEEVNQTAEQTSFTSKNFVEEVTQVDCAVVLSRSPGKQELLQSFVPMKSKLESHSCSFPSRDAKVKSEETVWWDLRIDPGFCHRFAALALVSSHRTRPIKHRFTGQSKLEKPPQSSSPMIIQHCQAHC